ncbi:MAG: aryl-sulfate sulfotransferase [Bacteroidota bacterium]
MKKIFYTFFFLIAFTLLAPLQSSAQIDYNPGIRFNSEEATEGYVLFQDDRSSVYLIDNCGRIVHRWPGSIFSEKHPKLLPNGNLLYMSGDDIIQRDWNGNVVDRLSVGGNGLDLAYEVILLPNQNYLCVVRRRFSAFDFQRIGYDVPGTTPNQMDGVVEFDRNTGGIVWQWRLSDHVIQERDATAPNYGILSENPQLINMDAVSTYDWNFIESFMINGMDYNPELDQIALSVRKISEVIIIDHSTTTLEAAGSTGGRYGKGGDILYRWGNPYNYRRGSPEDRVLFFQHNPNWIEYGPHKGKMICYNNGLNRPGVTFENRYSTAPIFDPATDGPGNYVIEEGEAFQPVQPNVSFDRISTNTPFYSSYTSGAKVMPNGNIFITEGVNGRLIEIDSTGKEVWSYVVPDVSYIFRTEKYPIDYPAFEGRDLTPLGTLESPPSDYNCQLITSTEDLPLQRPSFQVHYFRDGHGVQVLLEDQSTFQLRMIDLQGRVLREAQNLQGTHDLFFGSLPAGLYIVQLQTNKATPWQSYKIVVP